MSILIDGTAGTMITGYDPADRTTSSATTSPTSATTGSTGRGGRGHRRRRRPRRALGLEFDADQVTGIEINNNILDIVTNKLGDFTDLESNPRVRLRQRRGPQLADPVRRPVRHDPDVADRHLGRLVGRRLCPVGELALHDRRVEHVLRPHRRRRHAVGVPVVLAARPPAVRDAAHRGLAPRCSTQRGVEDPRDHVLIFEGPPTQFGATPATILVRRSRSPTPSRDDHRQGAPTSASTPILSPDEVSPRTRRSPTSSPPVAPRGPRAVRRGPVPAHRQPAVLLPDGEDQHVPQGEGFSDDLVFRPVLTLGLAGAGRAAAGRPLHRPAAGEDGPRAEAQGDARPTTPSSPASASGSCSSSSPSCNAWRRSSGTRRTH